MFLLNKYVISSKLLILSLKYFQGSYIEITDYVCTGILFNQDQNSYKVIFTSKEAGQHLPHLFVQTPGYTFISKHSELMLIQTLKVFTIELNNLHLYNAAHLVISKCRKTLIKPQKLLEDNEAIYISLVINPSFISLPDVHGST